MNNLSVSLSIVNLITIVNLIVTKILNEYKKCNWKIENAKE